jgi:hypothetical protein
MCSLHDATWMQIWVQPWEGTGEDFDEDVLVGQAARNEIDYSLPTRWSKSKM